MLLRISGRSTLRVSTNSRLVCFAETAIRRLPLNCCNTFAYIYQCRDTAMHWKAWRSAGILQSIENPLCTDTTIFLRASRLAGIPHYNRLAACHTAEILPSSVVHAGCYTDACLLLTNNTWGSPFKLSRDVLLGK